jgi:hypothetical protein
MNLMEKLAYLRKNKQVKCEIKWEVNELHDKARNRSFKPNWWGVSGGLSLVREVKREEMFRGSCLRVMVELGGNCEDDRSEHWTNDAGL